MGTSRRSAIASALGSTQNHLVVLVAFALLIAGILIAQDQPAAERAENDPAGLAPAGVQRAAAQAAADARSIAHSYFGVDPIRSASSDMSISTDLSEISNALALFKGAVQSPDAQKILAGRTLPTSWSHFLQAQESVENTRRSLAKLENALEGVGAGGIVTGAPIDPAIAVADLVDHNRELQIRNLQLIGQVANLERRAGVTGKPPCWVTPDGRAEYTYKITITDLEFVVEPIWRRNRAADMARIGASATRETIRHDDAGFSRAMDPFLAFGAKSNPECRFFVQVVDETGPFKDAWQERLALVEAYFYKFWLK